MLRASFLLRTVCIACAFQQVCGLPDYTRYVDVFLGTENGGNMFPGVVPQPYSMVKLGPDVEDGATDAYSGFLPTGQVWGFSMMHESGTGKVPKDPSLTDSSTLC